MSFLTLKSGSRATGSAEGAFVSQFRVIPNNSKLLAVISKFEKKSNSNGPYWQVTWEVVQGEFKGQSIWQFLSLHNPNYPDLADRNKEMFARIFVCCGMAIPEIEPDAYKLAQMQGKVCGIKVIEKTYEKDGETKEKNEISEVHPSDAFIEEIGVKMTHHVKKQSKSAYSEVNPPPFQDDSVPF